MAAYWNTALLGQKFALEKCSFNSSRATKTFFSAENSLESATTGFELDCDHQFSGSFNILILDIDYSDKKNQRKAVLTPAALKIVLSWTEIYSEESLNGGLHVVFVLSESFVHRNSKARLDISESADFFAFEFKKKSLVWPTPGYKQIVAPTTIVPISFGSVLCHLNTLFACYQASAPGLVCPQWTQFIISAEEYSVDNMLPAEAPSNPEIETALRNLEVTGTVARGDDESEEEEVIIAEEPASSGAKKRKRISKTSSSGFETNIKRLMLQSFKTMESSGATVTPDHLAAANQDSTSSVEFLVNKVYERNVEEVFQAIRSLGPEYESVKVSFLMYVADSIKKLHEFIIRKAKNDKGRIFGENVKLFLQYMLRSDSELISADEVLSKGVYSTLVETSKWIKWTTAYCQLVIFLEGLQDANGRHSRINRFDDYAIYREVTKRNACGRRLTEQEAFAEYMTIRGKVEARFAHSYENCWYRFEMFILTTLAVLRIHRRSVSAFCTFIDYICDPLQEIDLYVDIFFKVLLPTYNFKIAFIAEEVEFDKYEPTAAIYFKNYPWVLSSSDIFKRFLSSNFPNLPATRQFYGNHPSVDQLIRYINSQDRTSLDVRSAAFKRWWRQLPFANGVLDFDYISSTLDSLTRRLNSRGSNPRSRDALQREVRALGDIVRTEAQVNTYASLADRLNKERNLLVQLRAFGVNIDIEDLNRYKSFSVFRNYLDTDSVLSPIEYPFAVDSYVHNFERCRAENALEAVQTHLLSLFHPSAKLRYSEEFCAYMRCLLGADTKSGFMGPFQYVRLLTLIIFIAQALMRTKTFQTSLNIVGRGSNGKSQFIEFVRDALGSSKIVYIVGKAFFAGGETNQMKASLDEEVFIIYDIEATEVDIANFKTFVTDSVPSLSRKLYRNIDSNKQNYASVIMCSNDALRYQGSGHRYDPAFHRRVLLLPFWNLLGVEKKQRVAEDEEVGAVDNMFTRSGFDIKNVQTVKRIKEGLFVYILDVLHTFGLSSLNSTNNDYIVSSLANQRQLGVENYVFLQVIRDQYVMIDEVATTRTQLRDRSGPALDLAKFFFQHAKSRAAMKDTNIDHVCDLLSTVFGLHIEKREVSTSDFDFADSAPTRPGVQNPWAADIGRYFAFGLMSKSEISSELFSIYKNPNQPYEPSYAYGNVIIEEGTPVSDLTDKQLHFFANGNIPIGHRFFFNASIERKVNEVIYCLCSDQPVQADQKPLKHERWVQCKDLIETKDWTQTACQ